MGAKNVKVSAEIFHEMNFQSNLNTDAYPQQQKNVKRYIQNKYGSTIITIVSGVTF